MSLRPFRFGITFGGSPTRREFLHALQRAEAMGFEVVASADHIGSRLAVLPLLAVAAELSSMRVSPMVIANDYRHPVNLARETATIDRLTEGRFELGIGTGWIEDQYRAAGLPYDEPSVRVDRFEEAIAIIKGCWSGQPFSFEGEHYEVAGLECPTPFQRPRPPILIAGSRPRMLRIAGREADIVGISPLSKGASGFDVFHQGMARSGERLEAQLQWVREGAGDRFGDIELSVIAHHFEEVADPIARAGELARTWGATPGQVLESPHVFFGPTGRLVETLLERRERYNISYVVFSSAHLEQVGPAVARLAGS